MSDLKLLCVGGDWRAHICVPEYWGQTPMPVVFPYCSLTYLGVGVYLSFLYLTDSIRLASQQPLGLLCLCLSPYPAFETCVGSDLESSCLCSKQVTESPLPESHGIQSFSVYPTSIYHHKDNGSTLNCPHALPILSWMFSWLGVSLTFEKPGENLNFLNASTPCNNWTLGA